MQREAARVQVEQRADGPPGGLRAVDACDKKTSSLPCHHGFRASIDS
jgi:hypothetical protein